jgi:rhodanese-related sulfurtransferase
MTVQQLQAALTAESAARPVLLDVREPWEWQLARIAGSRHLPMRDVQARIDDLDKSHPTVVICHHGVRSLQVVANLQRQGFANLHNLHGGIDAWARIADPGMPVY